MSSTNRQSNQDRKPTPSIGSGRLSGSQGNGSQLPNKSQKTPPKRDPTGKKMLETPSESAGTIGGNFPIFPGRTESRVTTPSSHVLKQEKKIGENAPTRNTPPGRPEDRISKPTSSSTGSTNLKSLAGFDRLKTTEIRQTESLSVNGAPTLDLPNTTESRNKMILAHHLKRLLFSNTSLTCYKINLDVRRDMTISKAAIEAFVREVLSKAPSYVFTDYQEFVLSPCNLPHVVTQRTEVTMTLPNGTKRASVALELLKTLQWHSVLKFLNTGFTDDSARQTVLSVVKVLAAPVYRAQNPPNTKEKPWKFLDVRVHDADPELSRDIDQFSEQPLAGIINKYQAQQSWSVRGLDTYLKGRRVVIRRGTTCHMQNGSSQYSGSPHSGSPQSSPSGSQNGRIQQTPKKRMKIVGLARPDDGRDSQDPHPKVDKFGGSSEEVQFYYTDSTKRHGNSDPPASPSRYITVADYFKQIKGVSERLELPLINVGTRRKPTYLPPELCNVLVPRESATSEFTRGDLEDMIKATDPQAFLQMCGTKHNFRLPGLKLLLEQAGSYPIGVMVGTILAPYRPLQSPKIIFQDGTLMPTKYGAWTTNELKDLKDEKKTKCQLVVVRIGVGNIPGTVEYEIQRTKNKLEERMGKHGIKLELNTSFKPVAIKGLEQSLKTLKEHITNMPKQKGFKAVLAALPDDISVCKLHANPWH